MPFPRARPEISACDTNHLMPYVPPYARRRLSPLVLRILAVNVMALAILVGSLLYLGRYQERLIQSEIDALMLQARLSASALGEGAVVVDEDERNILSPLLARLMIRRLVEATGTRTRLFDLDGAPLADSRNLADRNGKLPPDDAPKSRDKISGITKWAMTPFDLIDRLIERENYPIYQDEKGPRGSPYELARKALAGEHASQVWSLPNREGLILSVAVPVQRYKQILGAVVLSRSDAEIDAAIREVRLNILTLFGVTLLITVMLSFYLARAIARPLRQLAYAAESVRHGQMQIMGMAGTAKLLNNEVIPDLGARNDEIGDLSLALRDMTAALARRIGAIENFAADVAHEIKNPLTSLRSAVETAERVADPAMQRRLMLVIRDDVDRLDRLISDISNASRLDAELSRDEAKPVDIGEMLRTLTGFYGDETPVVLAPLPDEKLMVTGVEVRLVQVVQNLIANALSFSPQGGGVKLEARHEGGDVVMTACDDGPGIPENKLEAIFDRFYSERPKAEKFGTHSGLGLSISRQIVEAHRGRIWAENRKDSDGAISGARFLVRLPAGK